MGGNASSLRIEPTITIQGHVLCTAEEECKTGRRPVGWCWQEQCRDDPLCPSRFIIYLCMMLGHSSCGRHTSLLSQPLTPPGARQKRVIFRAIAIHMRAKTAIGKALKGVVAIRGCFPMVLIRRGLMLKRTGQIELVKVVARRLGERRPTMVA